MATPEPPPFWRFPAPSLDQALSQLCRALHARGPTLDRCDDYTGGPACRAPLSRAAVPTGAPFADDYTDGRTKGICMHGRGRCADYTIVLVMIIAFMIIVGAIVTSSGNPTFSPARMVAGAGSAPRGPAALGAHSVPDQSGKGGGSDLPGRAGRGCGTAQRWGDVFLLARVGANEEEEEEEKVDVEEKGNAEEKENAEEKVDAEEEEQGDFEFDFEQWG